MSSRWRWTLLPQMIQIGVATAEAVAIETLGSGLRWLLQIKKAIGNVPNTFAAIGAHGPAALKAVLAADAVLASGPLSDF